MKDRTPTAPAPRTLTSYGEEAGGRRTRKCVFNPTLMPRSG